MAADEALGAGDMGSGTDKTLVSAVGTLKANNPSGIETDYWLASRYYRYGSSSSWTFAGWSVNDGWRLGYNHLLEYSNGWDINSTAYAIRPILTLKSTVKIIGGTGTSDDNYKLGL